MASVIIRNDNPNLGKVLAEFGETIEMFSHKPSIGYKYIFPHSSGDKRRAILQWGTKNTFWVKP